MPAPALRQRTRQYFDRILTIPVSITAMCPLHVASAFLRRFSMSLPFGKGQNVPEQQWPSGQVVGGWELSGVMLFQSGPFMSTSILSDPSGTGYNIYGNLYERRASRHGAGSESLRRPIRSTNGSIPTPLPILRELQSTGYHRYRPIRRRDFRLHRRAWHAGRFAVADQALYHQGTDSGGDRNASSQRIQPCQLCHADS